MASDASELDIDPRESYEDWRDYDEAEEDFGPPRPSHVQYTKGALQVDFRLSYDCWSDPGDYPSNAGSGPLPDGPPYCEDIDGKGTYRLSAIDRIEYAYGDWDDLSDFIRHWIGPEIPGVIVTKWGVDASGDFLTFWPEEWDEEN